MTDTFHTNETVEPARIAADLRLLAGLIDEHPELGEQLRPRFVTLGLTIYP